jgi:hypothetical protein
MTSAMPAIPSGLPEDLYHSAPMVLVRYPGETVFASARIRRRLTVKAITLACVCAALAFFFSALRERKQAPAAPAAVAPIVAPRETAAAGPTPALAPRHFLLPERPDRKITEFILAASPEFQSLGPVKLRLAGVDAQRGSYNLSVRMRGRQFTRTNVKVDQAVKLGNGKKAAPEIVVGVIVQNRVWGYLSEPKTKAQSSSHRHRRRRL